MDVSVAEVTLSPSTRCCSSDQQKALKNLTKSILQRPNERTKKICGLTVLAGRAREAGLAAGRTEPSVGIAARTAIALAASLIAVGAVPSLGAP